MDDLLDRYLSVVEHEQRRPELIEGKVQCGIRLRVGFVKVRDISTPDCAKRVSEHATRNGARSGDTLRSALKNAFAFGVELGVRPDNPAALASTNRKTAPEP